MKKQQNTRQSTKTSTEYYPVSESFKKKFFINQTLFLLNNVIRIALSIVLIVQISITDIEPFLDREQYKRIQQITKLWEKEAIVDIITISSYNCPEGYEIFTSAVWPGTKQGCFCSVQLGVYDYFHTLPGYCDGKLIQAGCTRIQPRKSVPFTFWKPNQLICIKRIANLNFYANLSGVQNTQKCAQGKDYEIQSLSVTGCPITNLKNDSSLDYVLSDINFSYNRQDNYPIIDLKVTQYDFCPQYNRSNISPNRFQNYVLETIQIEHCEGTDPRVEQIDRMTQEQAYFNNQRLLYVIKQLPGFPEPSKQFIYKLGITRYPSWTYQCRTSDEFSLPITRTKFSLSQQVNTSQITIALVIILISCWGIIYSIIYFVVNIIEIRYKWKNKILFLDDSQIAQIDPNLLYSTTLSLTGTLTLFLFIFILGIATVVIIGVQYERISQFEQWLRGSLQCTGYKQYFVQYIGVYTDFFQQLVRTFLVCILICVVIIVIDILYLLWRINQGDLASKDLSDIFRISERNSDEEQISQKPLEIQMQKQLDEKQEKIRKDSLLTQGSNINMAQNLEQSVFSEQVMVETVSSHHRKRKKNKKKLFRTMDLQFD